LIGVQQTQELTAVSFIQTKQKYVYMEIASRKYATIVIDKAKNRNKRVAKSVDRVSVLQRKTLL